MPELTAEFEKWLGIRSSILVYNLSTVVASARQDQIRDWEQRGGVLLVSVNLLVSLKEKEFNPNSCDVLVMDEAAVFLKSTSTQMYKKLQAISTPRRIGEYDVVRPRSEQTQSLPLISPFRFRRVVLCSSYRLAASEQRKYGLSKQVSCFDSLTQWPPLSL